jgi:hypothetical protein
MMSAYFSEPENWRHPALYAEIQLTGWLYDGGVLLWVFYPMGLFLAMRYSYRLAADRHFALNESAMTVFAIQLLLVGLCFTGPVFNSQLGMMFWLTTAMLYGAHRTCTIDGWAYVPGEGEHASDGTADQWADAR